METLFIVIAGVLMLVGLAGIIIPFLPGVFLVWGGLFVYGLTTGFQSISQSTVLIFFLLSSLLIAVDFFAPLLGAKKYKASNYSMLGAFIGAVIGIFIFSVFGIAIGAFIGAFLGELIAGKNNEKAFTSALGAFFGFLIGTLLKLALALTMVGFFIASLF